MLLLDNPVQRYAWGRRDGLAEVLGTPATGGPEAELWVGTHQRGPSTIAQGPLAGRTLAEVVAADPVRWLGAERAGRGERSLPFLLKVLAIGQPLSLQAHPTSAQARAGFAREESTGVPIDADERTYRDRSAKPEVLVALEEVVALCGFRAPRAAADLLRRLGDVVAPMIGLLEVSDDPLEDGLAWLLQLDPQQREAVARAARMASASAPTSADAPLDPWAWVRHLGEQHPGDPTCVAPLLLELVHLDPWDAVHLPAGNLHAYLTGVGIEIMASSDNVLRGGLTPKHVDVAELLHVLRFEPGVPARPQVHLLGSQRAYDAGEEAFALAVVPPGIDATWIDVSAPSLLLPVGRSATIAAEGERLEVGPGQAVAVAPGSEVLVRSAAPVWWATTGDGLPGLR
jgi:mannose-6-phosphate isomerase